MRRKFKMKNSLVEKLKEYTKSVGNFIYNYLVELDKEIKKEQFENWKIEYQDYKLERITKGYFNN